MSFPRNALHGNHSGMEKPIFLLTEDIPGLVLGGDPESLAREHPLWAQSIKDFGPWTETGILSIDFAANEDRPAAIRGWESARTCATGIFLVQSCSSALDVAWKFLRWGMFQDWDAVIAVRQWTGRGQVRRPWSSLPGNLHVVWRQPALPAGWDGLASLVPAWLAARTLADLDLEIRIKWPNDLLWQDRKVGGILVEQRGEQMLVGLGLNLAACPSPVAIRGQAAVPGAALEGRISPVNCWNLLVSKSINWYQNCLSRFRPEGFIREFSTILAWQGRHVLFHEHGREDGLQAVVFGVSTDGGLIVSTKGATRTVFSGDIRLFR